MEPTKPPVWRSGSRNTARKVNAAVIAHQRSTASGVNQTVRLPRARSPASYSAQLRTRCRCFGM